MILIASDTPNRILRTADLPAYAEAKEAAFAAWRMLAPGHYELALAFAELACRRHLAGCRG